MMSESSKRHSKFLSLIFILKSLFILIKYHIEYSLAINYAPISRTLVYTALDKNNSKFRQCIYFTKGSDDMKKRRAHDPVHELVVAGGFPVCIFRAFGIT